MNLHKNARTFPKSRALMVSRVLEDGQLQSGVVVDSSEWHAQVLVLVYN